jgi:hypothetical protein
VKALLRLADLVVFLRTIVENVTSALGLLARDTDIDVLIDALVGPIYFRTFIRGDVPDVPFLEALVHEVLNTRT